MLRSLVSNNNTSTQNELSAAFLLRIIAKSESLYGVIDEINRYFPEAIDEPDAEGNYPRRPTEHQSNCNQTFNSML